ncbi:serpin family protein [Salana multivorans]
MTRPPATAASATGRRRVALACAAGVVATALVAACGSGSPATAEHRGEASYQPAELGEASALPGVLAANDELGLAMLTSAETPNVVVSPLSAVVALAMLGEGARSETAAAFDDALGAPGAERTAAVSALRAALLEHDGDPAAAAGDTRPEEPILHLATRALLDDQLVPGQDYLDVLSGSYDAAIETVDLGDPATKRTLDAWVKRETGGLIEESALTPSTDMRLALQDAIVFGASWLAPFSETATYEEEFETADGVREVPTMHGDSAWAWSVTDIDGWRSVRMPYTEAFVADLVLPPDGVDPADAPLEVLTARRTGDGATQVVTSDDPTIVVVSVPVLDLEPETLDLEPVLESVGLGELYGTPDLSGITTTEPLFVSQAFQQARLKLDQEGTVAAAVTEIGAEAGAAPMPEEEVEVRFDRPFLIRLAHEETSATLFLAAVREP